MEKMEHEVLINNKISIKTNREAKIYYQMMNRLIKNIIISFLLGGFVFLLLLMGFAKEIIF